MAILVGDLILLGQLQGLKLGEDWLVQGIIKHEVEGGGVEAVGDKDGLKEVHVGKENKLTFSKRRLRWDKELFFDNGLELVGELVFGDRDKVGLWFGLLEG